jgi:hypothetical protein
VTAGSSGGGGSSGLTGAGFEPGRYHEIPVIQLLRAAAHGWIGVDQRLVKSILDRGEAGMAEVLEFSREARDQPGSTHLVYIDPLLVDLFRHSPHPAAVDYFIDLIRREPDDVDDQLIQALLPLGAPAVDGLLKLYEELGEEQASDVAFVLAGLRVRDPRVLNVLLDRLEFDAADGAFCLGLYGDPAARPALERMLAEVSAEATSVEATPEEVKEDAELRREISFAIESLDAPEPEYKPEPFDILAEYPKEQLPEFDVLSDSERSELLASTEAAVRAEAAYSFFNNEITPKVRASLLAMARNDPDGAVRGRAWASLADGAEDKSIRAEMVSVLNDLSRPVDERGGAAVGLYGFADEADAQRGIEALYEEGGKARAKALEAMWRSLWKPYAKYFAPHLEDKDPAILHQALRGAGYFRLTAQADKIAKYLEDDDFREDALFAYALALPGETTRGRARGILRKIDSITPLDPGEIRLVKFAIDERLRLHGVAPVFEAESGMGEEPESVPEPPPAASTPPGRNDPCPCGSGKKYKKCHGK